MPYGKTNQRDTRVDAGMKRFRTGVQLPPPPPAFARRAAASEGCAPETSLWPPGHNDAKAGWVFSRRDYGWQAMTDNISARLQKHNEGGVPHTAKFRPWQLETAVAFRDRNKAAAFERYLKTGSGREFARRQF